MKIVSHIVGCGSYLPQRVVTNEELARTVDTSDAWIVERTGIRERHMAAPGELTSDLAHHAAGTLQSLRRANALVAVKPSAQREVEQRLVRVHVELVERVRLRERWVEVGHEQVDGHDGR